MVEDRQSSAGDPVRWCRRASTDAYKGDRSREGPHRESEGFIVPFEGMGQHNPARGKGPCFVHATEEWRMRGLQRC